MKKTYCLRCGVETTLPDRTPGAWCEACHALVAAETAARPAPGGQESPDPGGKLRRPKAEIRAWKAWLKLEAARLELERRAQHARKLPDEDNPGQQDAVRRMEDQE